MIKTYETQSSDNKRATVSEILILHLQLIKYVI